MYGDVATSWAASYLKQEIQGGDALSAYLINLMTNLQDFVWTISTLSDQKISNPDVMLPLISNLFQSTGLAPLLPLLLSDGPLNVSKVLEVASQLGRLNQHIFTFNETDPTMPELERLIMHFLSLEGNLTLPISHIMGSSLLTYSNYFNADDVARLREAIKPFTNQTSAGVVETILSAIELLKTVTDSPNGDPTNIIIGYIRQLQEFVASLFRLRKIEQLFLPNGQLNTTEVTDLHMLSKDFLSLLTPEGLENLTQAGPDVAQDLVIQKFLAFLPPELQQEASLFFQDFKDLQYQLTLCTAGHNCLSGIPQMFTFLDQILELILATHSDVTITIAGTDTFLQKQEDYEIASLVFSLLLSPKDAPYVETFKQTLHFIKLVTASPNITVSLVQNALRQSNLTVEELNHIATLAGAANINNLIVNIMDIANVPSCFESQQDTSVTADCVMGLITKVSSFLKHIPRLRNETDILSLVSLIINQTAGDVLQVNFSSSANMAVVHALNKTLANIKANLQLNNLTTPEIMNEIRMVEGLLKVIANPDPLNYLSNISSMSNPLYYNKGYLEVVQWYLQRLENVTSTSSVSELLYPFFQLTQMQLTLQLAQTDLSLYFSDEMGYLAGSLQLPIDAAGVTKLGQTTTELLRQIIKYVNVYLEVQDGTSKAFGSEPLHNATMIHAAERQIHQYLDLVQKWFEQPNVTLILTSMLQWGNTSMNFSTPGRDLHLLLQTMSHFLTDDQLIYLSYPSNIIQALNRLIMVAEQPGGFQGDHLIATIMEAVQSAFQIMKLAIGTLPYQQAIQDIIQDSLELIIQPDLSFATSLNISLGILERAESVIQQAVPEMFAVYLLSGVKVATTYLETVSSANGPDNWNQM